MESLVATEKQLVADVAALRDRFPNTQELYREVCTVMFFRYGITPTANKLYQYVKKGSMSATEALGKFWDTPREKSWVCIEHPDLPEDLKSRVGGAVGSGSAGGSRFPERLPGRRKGKGARSGMRTNPSRGGTRDAPEGLGKTSIS